ncbi:MAG TPA: hypothetical protein VFW44_02310 [Bryobacteraceae bacterium]|nr:hypothetical protein [Bryobacteraceae bacterium]
MASLRFIHFLAPLLLAGSLWAQGPQFTIQDLGTLPDLPACNATALSQSGNVAGYCTAASGQNLVLNGPMTHAFIYSNGKMTDLNISSLNTPIPTGVNDSGTVVGGQLTVNFGSESATATPFIYQNGAFVPPPGQLQSALPFALNNAGQMVGASIQINDSSNDFVLISGAFLDTLSTGKVNPLGAGSNGSGGGAFGISPQGVIAGAAVGSNASSFSPVIWKNLTAQTLPLLSGYTQGLASAANDAGAEAGVAFNIDFSNLFATNNTAHAVLYQGNSVTDLGVLPGDAASLATSINSSGTVVGFSSSQGPDVTIQLADLVYAPSNKYHAFIYSGGKMYNLTRQLVNGAGWQLSFAVAINDAGQIVGSGLLTDANGGSVQHAFLLTPAAVGPIVSSVEGAGLSTPAVTNISANGIVTIFGSKLATATVELSSDDIVNHQLPTNLGGTCVESGTSKWGLFYVSPTQINALAGAPPTTPITDPLSTKITVVTNCGTANEVASAVVMVPQTTVSPEFLYFQENSNGANPVAAIYPNGAYVGPAGLISGATFTPAKAGDVLTAFGVGWGPTTSADPVGTVATSAQSLTSNYSLTLGGKPVSVAYAGLSPEYAGLYQINFTVPSGLSAGNQPLVLTVDGVATSATAYIAIGK